MWGKNNISIGNNSRRPQIISMVNTIFESIENLRTKKEKADAYRILCDYALNGKMPDLSGASPVIATIFGFAKPVLDTAHKRAELAKKLSDQKQMEGGTVCVLHQQV